MRASEHEGPIKGWHKNVEQYQQRKAAEPPLPEFRPRLNSVSKSIMRRAGNQQRVEDRLLKVGEKMTEHKIRLRERLE